MNIKNSKEWETAYLDISEKNILNRIRDYFQKKNIFKIIKDKNSRILDVGCGNGKQIKYLYTSGYKNLYGIEPDIKFVNLLKQNNSEIYKNIFHGFSYKLPFEDSFFDCIYFYNVLHHLNDLQEYEKTFEEFNRCLTPHGTVIILEPCNKIIYSILKNTARISKTFSKSAFNIYKILEEEEKNLNLFFKKHLFFKNKLIENNYIIIKDSKLFHQWTLIAKKQ